jgi:tRNA nucleotidyltransferase/poly(A) polymerase
MNVLSSAYLADLISLVSQPLYLVGGSVRDLLIGVPNIKDIDLLMPSGSEEIARAFLFSMKSGRSPGW